MPDTQDEVNPDPATVSDQTIHLRIPLWDYDQPDPTPVGSVEEPSNASTAGDHSDQVDEVHQVRIQHEYSNSDNSPPHSTVTTHPMSLHDAIEHLRSLL